jgi:4-amino-4-deoxy-L-arabinose transferase-like glycosyltransferase
MKQALAEAQIKERASEPEFEEATSEDWSKIRFYAFLVYLIGLACILYFSLSIYWSKFSRAEVFFADCARAMIESNNLVTPVYREHPFFDKPILTYWLIVAMFKNFGYLHLAARVPSIFAGLSSVALTGLAGAFLFSRKVGIMAAGMVASAFMFFAFSALCMSDALLVFFDTVTMTCLYASLQENSRRHLFFWIASVSAGLAFMTKGPVGIVLPAASFLIYAVMIGRWRMISLRDILLGGLTASVIAIPWFVAAYQANGWSALVYFFVHENLQRFTGGVYDAQKPVWYTLVSLFYGFAPWSIFLPLSLVSFARTWGAQKDTPQAKAALFLWTWIAVTLAFFSISKGKCDYYMLPVYPAAAILVGKFIDEQINLKRRLVPITLALFAVGFFIAAGASGYIAHAIVGGSPVAWVLAPLVMIATSLFMAFELEERRYLPAVLSACGGILLSVAVFSMQVLPAVLNQVPIDKYAAYISMSPSNVPVVIEHQLYSWQDEITFLTGRHPEVPEDMAALTARLKNGKPSMLIANKSTWQEMPIALRQKFRQVSQDAAITKPLTPGLVISTGGKLTSSDPVLLLANY